jgi:hypothetical protein
MGFEEFVAVLEEQERRIGFLLACKWRPPGFADKTPASKAKVRWTRDITDPEFKKNLRILYRLIEGTRGMCGRAKILPFKYNETLKPRLGELKHLVTLPGGEEAPPLTLKLLLAQRFQLERLLIEVGDDEYLRSRAADLHSEDEGTLVTWNDLFPGQLPPLLEEPPSPPDPAERTRHMLQRLIAAKEERDLPLRARRELKQRVLMFVVPVIAATTVIFGFAIGRIDPSKGNAYLLAAAAGAAGAAVGGLIGLRDEVNRGAQMRTFSAFFFGQIVVGVAAGLLAYLVVNAELVRVGTNDAGLAALAFVAGFSEAAFLGLVGLVGKSAGAKT